MFSVTDRLPANVDHKLIPPGEFLSEIPMSINNFYDKILSDGAVGGQNKTLLFWKTYNLVIMLHHIE